MSMGKVRTILFAVLFAANAHVASGVVVKPTPAQKKTLDKVIPAILRVLDRFGNKDWSLSQDWYDGDPLMPVHCPPVLDINQNFQRDYEVRPGSERFTRLIVPLNAQIEEMMKQSPIPYDRIEKLGNTMRELSQLQVYVYVNRANIEGRAVSGNPAPGAAMVTRIDRGYFAYDDWKSYFIAFGNWKTARWNAADHLHEFRFARCSSPCIQNIVVVMTGAPDRMKELMGKIDWNVLNEALR